MRRIDRYWKRCGACLLAAVTLMLGQGTMQSYAMNAQVINSPDRIVVQDENKNTGNQNNTNTQTVTTKAEVAGFGEVSTPVTDSSSYFGKGRLTLLANHRSRRRLDRQYRLCIKSDQGKRRTCSGMADHTS